MSLLPYHLGLEPLPAFGFHYNLLSCHPDCLVPMMTVCLLINPFWSILSSDGALMLGCWLKVTAFIHSLLFLHPELTEVPEQTVLCHYRGTGAEGPPGARAKLSPGKGTT